MTIELFKTDSKGKIRIYKTWTEGADLVQEAGLYQGNLVPQRKTCVGKNIGRSNETHPFDQAKAEMESRVAKKLDEGYFKTVDEAKNNKTVLPMLAKEYKTGAVDYTGKVFTQPKLDGMRCLAFITDGKVSLMSRKGKAITTMQHLEVKLLEISDGETIVLDGELYAHGRTFQENMRLIKKYREGESEEVKYHVYDTISDKPFFRRFQDILHDGVDVRLVKTTDCRDEDSLKAAHAINISEGYEGTIVRHGAEPYHIDKRSSSLLKYKDFIDIALPIIDMEAAEQRPDWGIPVFELDGKRFKSGVRASHAERRLMLRDKAAWIGKVGELRFFEYSDDGIPRFPVMVGLRLDK